MQLINMPARLIELANTCTIQKETCGFKCTGFEGKHIWDERMKITKSIECESCRDHAVKDESAYHDHVSAGLGKNELHNEENYLRYADEVACVRAAYCKRTRRC